MPCRGCRSFCCAKNLPNIERPYRSPLGVPGAAVTVVIALVTLYFQLQDPVYRNGVYAVAAFYVLGLLYFAFFGRHHLILSPEEEFAISKARGPSSMKATARTRCDDAWNRDKVKTAADARAIVAERELTHVKVGAFDIDGILRGKYMSRAKFESALESGFGFCDVVLGWD